LLVVCIPEIKINESINISCNERERKKEKKIGKIK